MSRNAYAFGFATRPGEISILIGTDLCDGFHRLELSGCNIDGMITFRQTYVFYGDKREDEFSARMDALISEVFTTNPNIYSLEYENADDMIVHTTRGINSARIVEYGQ